jgi:signal peptidase I
VLVLTTAFFLQPYRPVIVRGDSMLPTINSGQLLFSVPLKRMPKHGDLVLVDHDGSTLVKRVSMVPGDTFVEARSIHSDIWFVADTATIKNMVKRKKVPSRISHVPDGMIYITGDNPEKSLDSRQFGYVPISSIRGVIVPIT